MNYQLKTAVVLTRIKDGKTQYRISPRELFNEKDVPLGGFFSNWCSSEERAWKAALSRTTNKSLQRESW
jgi:hypothetical protein